MRSLKERQRVHRMAELKVSKDMSEDHFDFMSNCMQDKLDSGDAEDVWDAEEQCQLEWEDQQDTGESDGEYD